MTRRWSLVGAVTLVALLALVAGLSSAQKPGTQGLNSQGEVSIQALLGTAFTYQGLVTRGDTPVNDTCDFRFKLWDAESGGTLLGSETKSGVSVNDGFFTVQPDFGEGAFQGDARWLQVEVKCSGDTDYVDLGRQPVTPTPYALALPGLWTQQNSQSPNLIGGYSGNTVTEGVVGATIGGGGTDGYPNIVTDNYGTVGGGLRNQAGDNAGTTSDKLFATVGGGAWNMATGSEATVSGGIGNKASGETASIGGGSSNLAGGDYAVVSGGRQNSAAGRYAVVGGGWANTVDADYATIAGGGPSNPDDLANTKNRVYDNYGTIGGGGNNKAGSDDSFPNNASYATVGGGCENTASDGYTTVGGGEGNTASYGFATVGGGTGNVASMYAATIGGGFYNEASGSQATVSGGGQNTADGSFATVGGGCGNNASGDYATVPGGSKASASHYGQMAYASGYFASPGDAQASLYVLRNTTTDSTQTELFLNGFDKRITIASGQTMSFDILIVARSSGQASAGYHITGVIENYGGTTSFIGTPTVTTLGEDRSTWGVDVEASDSYDALRILVTGESGFNVRWVASVRMAEVSW